MGRFYAILAATARRGLAAGTVLLALGCLPAPPALPPAAMSLTEPAPPQPAPSLTPEVSGAEGTLRPTPGPPRLPTVPLPDPDRTAWPGPMDRFQDTAVLEEAGLAGPIIGFHLARDRVSFRVHYTPGEARYLREWALELRRTGPEPLLVLPGGFFTADHFAQGLLVADGYQHSGPYGFGGLFVVQGGEPDIRWIRPQPIEPGEEFDQAVQAFPIYVSRGAIVPLNEHESRAPRTVLVETRAGDFVALLSLTSLFRTIDLPTWLIDSDLDVYNALNLDGGRSAGYWAGEADYADSFVPLPVVIAVYAD
jgi:uncharacterized protein YigE (DUF2233 family)